MLQHRQKELILLNFVSLQNGLTLFGSIKDSNGTTSITDKGKFYMIFDQLNLIS